MCLKGDVNFLQCKGWKNCDDQMNGMNDFSRETFFLFTIYTKLFFQKSSGKHNQRIMNGAPSEIKFLYTRNLIFEGETYLRF